MTLTLKEDMYNIFLDVGFEEDVIYTPSGGSAKTISAIIYRDGLTSTNTSRRVGGETQSKMRNYAISISISTDATEGIETITVNEDFVALKRRVNDAANSNFRVSGIMEDDEGAWLLGLKA